MSDLKNVLLEYGIKYIAMVGFLLLPIKNALIVVLLLVLMDTIVGVWAAIKEGYKITSRSLRRTLSKLLVYEFAIVVTFMIETYLLQDIPIVKVITGLIGVIEGKSLFENLYRITKIDFLKVIITKLQLVRDELHPQNDKDLHKTFTGKKKNEHKDEE